MNPPLPCIGKKLHCVCEVNGAAHGIALSLSDSCCNCFVDNVTFTLLQEGSILSIRRYAWFVFVD